MSKKWPLASKILERLTQRTSWNSSFYRALNIQVTGLLQACWNLIQFPKYFVCSLQLIQRQGCAQEENEGSQVLWSYEIQGAQKNLRFSCHPQAEEQHHTPMGTAAKTETKQPSFRDAKTGFSMKWCLRNEHRIPYWWCVPTQIWVVLPISWRKFPMWHVSAVFSGYCG